jgi:hypothetical protein
MKIGSLGSERSPPTTTHFCLLLVAAVSFGPMNTPTSMSSGFAEIDRDAD